ncbi:MAG: trehalase family glycosidase [Armatimonadota bacterium]|nr:trehalase family glycosidase [Armatimonadota bacterium]
MDERQKALDKKHYTQALMLRDDEVERFLPRRFLMGSRLFIRRKATNEGFFQDSEEIRPTVHEWGLGWISYSNASVTWQHSAQPANLRIKDGRGDLVGPEDRPIHETWSPAGYKADWRTRNGLTLTEELSLRDDVFVNIIRIRNNNSGPQDINLSLMGFLPGHTSLERKDRAWQVEWDSDRHILRLDVNKLGEREESHDAGRASASLLSMHGDFDAGDPRFAPSRIDLQDGRGRDSFDNDLPDEHNEWAYDIPLSGRIEAGETKTLTLAYTVYPRNDMASSSLKRILKNAGKSYALAEKEWDEYLANEVPTLKCDNPDYVKLYYWNWYADRANMVEYIDHPAISKPIVVDDKIRYMNFQCVGCYSRRLQMERWLKNDMCRNGLETLLAGQTSEGNCGIVVDQSGKNKQMLTEMPLLTAAVWAHFEVTWDKEFLRRALPTLVKYDDFFRKYRDADGDGLIEVKGMGEIGTYDDSPRCYEMGATRWFDWTFGNQPAEPIDVNSVIYLQRTLIARMAGLLGDKNLQKEFESRAAELKQKIDKVMWDADRSLYTDVYGPDHTKVQTKTPAMFVPLRVGLADEKRARHLIQDHLLNPKEFWSERPIPSLSYDDKNYKLRVLMACQSHGDISIDLVWDAITGLANYGHTKKASELTDTTVKLMVKDGIPTSGERYAPNGRPIGGQLYGWSNLINDAIITRIFGISSDPEKELIIFDPKLPASIHNFSLSGVKIAGGDLTFSCVEKKGVMSLTVRNNGNEARRVRLGTTQALLEAGKEITIGSRESRESQGSRLGF